MAIRSVLRSPVRSGLASGVGSGTSVVDYSAEADALFAAMSVKPNATRKALVDALIEGLKTDSLWTPIDFLYVQAAHDEQAGRLNWKAPGTFTLNPVSSPTFTTDRGFSFNGSSSYLDTGWDPATNGFNYTRNSACFAIWSRTAGQVALNCFGTGTAAAITIQPRNSGNVTAYRINQTTAAGPANTDGSGLFAMNRSGASATQAYRNAVSLGTSTIASEALSSVDINIGRANNQFGTQQIAVSLMAGSLDATQHTALFNRINTYMAAIGAA